MRWSLPKSEKKMQMQIQKYKDLTGNSHIEIIKRMSC